MRGKRFGILLWLMLLMAGGMALAQTAPFSVAVTPERVFLKPGEGVQFEAQLFDAKGNAVDFNDFRWIVKPDSLGEISDDGFFVAGKMPGEARIIAVMSRGGVRYYGEAVVVIGTPPPSRIKVIVTPKDVVVPPGQQQQFKVTVVVQNNASVTIDHIRWAVEPGFLGKINSKGLFQAGDRPGQGYVFALVEIDNAVYRGRARITVSERPTASISGTVTDENTGEPLIGAHVLVQRLGHIRWMRTARTDSNGTYTAGKLIPGLYVVRANARGYLPEYYDGVQHLSEATALQVSANDSLTGIDFQLGHGGAIAGLVATESDSLPIQGALVTAVHVVSQRKRHTVTREDGSYVLNSLPEGDYAVFVRAAGYKGEFYDNANSLNDATLLRVTPPDTIAGIDVYLSAGSAIAGHVSDAADGSPIAHALVKIIKPRDHRPARTFLAITDKDGNYIKSVPPGRYFVYAVARGYRGEFYDDKPTITQADTVEVLENQHTTGIDFDLVRLGSISGRVTDESTGEPIANATVIAFLEHPAVTPVAVANEQHIRKFRAETDSAGNYTIKNLHAGKYYVLAFARGYLPEFYKEATNLGDATPVEVQDSTEVTGIDFTLSSGGSIKGTVFDAQDSTVLAGAVVTVRSLDHRFRKRAYTDQNGVFRVGGLPPGKYILYAKAKGYKPKFYDNVDRASEATPVAVEPGQEVGGIDFYLPRFQTRLGTIAGTVVQEPDTSSESSVQTPIVGALVIAIPTKHGQAYFDFTDPFGNYRITNIKPGEYVVLAWAPGYLGEFYDNVRDWKSATRIEVKSNEVIEGIDFALGKAEEGPYHIRGVVRRGMGQNRRPVYGAVVYAFRAGKLAGSAVTDENGEFVMTGLPAGRYKIKASGVGMMTSFYGGTTEEAAQEVDLSNGQSAENIEINAEEVATGMADQPAAVPDRFQLDQNYPNPFNPETTIRFAVPYPAHVTLRIYNILGQVVRTLVDKNVEAGYHQIQWDGRLDNGDKAASGLYILRLEAGDFVQSRRMLLMK